jgi:hypothetical protein
LANNSLELFIAYQFITNLTTPFEKWDAYKLGIIDKKGNTIRSPKTQEEKNAFGRMTILARNIKRILAKLPMGKSKLASFAAALVLLKESKERTEAIVSEIEKKFPRTIDESYIGNLDAGKYIVEQELFDGIEDSFGMYIVSEDQKPAMNICGEDFYKLKDVVSRKTIYLPKTILRKIG